MFGHSSNTRFSSPILSFSSGTSVTYMLDRMFCSFFFSFSLSQFFRLGSIDLFSSSLILLSAISNQLLGLFRDISILVIVLFNSRISTCVCVFFFYSWSFSMEIPVCSFIVHITSFKFLAIFLVAALSVSPGFSWFGYRLFPFFLRYGSQFPISSPSS